LLRFLRWAATPTTLAGVDCMKPEYALTACARRFAPMKVSSITPMVDGTTRAPQLPLSLF
jgi:hypothetical protein